MIKHRTPRRGAGRRRSTVRTAILRPLALAGATAALIVGMMSATAPAGAAPAQAGAALAQAGPAPAPAKSAALARAKATGFAGLKGGHASGKAVGRSRVTRTARPPVLTPAQRRTLRHASALQALLPKHVQGTPALRRPRPVSPPIAGAQRARPALAKAAAAPTDFDYFRAQNVGPGIGQDSHNEPSVANDGNEVLYTGNFYAAQSTDSGHTFSFLNPFTLGPTPTLPNDGFCCNQVVIHAPTAGITAWGLMYCPANNCASGDNLIRLAVARNKTDLDADAFDYYDFSAQTFGFPEGDWLGYPQLGVNNDSLILTANVNDSFGPVDSILVKFSLAAFTTGTWSASWVFDNQDFTWTPVGNSGDSWTYWAATAFGNGGLIRVYNWPPNTDFHHVSWNDFSVGFNSATKNGSCAAADGHNWCAFDDSRVKTGGEVGATTAWFMWDAKQGGGFNYPYVEYAS